MLQHFSCIVCTTNPGDWSSGPEEKKRYPRYVAFSLSPKLYSMSLRHGECRCIYIYIYIPLQLFVLVVDEELDKKKLKILCEVVDEATWYVEAA